MFGSWIFVYNFLNKIKDKCKLRYVEFNSYLRVMFCILGILNNIVLN